MEKYPGVFQASKKDGTIYYRASLTFRGKHISLGSFSTPQDAHKAYTEGQFILSESAITLKEYKLIRTLSYEKFVVLLNFRDNNIYISTPIYIRNKFFQYFFKPHDYLIFDIDDLFYYSSHKIMRRGGHLFVAEYGMQTNILNRYGIRSYAVKGRDYRFINEDPRDFRYNNIEIINPYKGVLPINDSSKQLYQTKILINGEFLVGRYETLDEAAIAYNKAADMLKKAGLGHNYTLNYIEGLSPALYADIYSKCSISENLQRYITDATSLNNQ